MHLISIAKISLTNYNIFFFSFLSSHIFLLLNGVARASELVRKRRGKICTVMMLIHTSATIIKQQMLSSRFLNNNKCLSKAWKISSLSSVLLSARYLLHNRSSSCNTHILRNATMMSREKFDENKVHKNGRMRNENKINRLQIVAHVIPSYCSRL